MTDDAHGLVGNEPTAQSPKIRNEQSSLRANGLVARPDPDVERRPYAVARWSGRASLRRGARGLFITRWRWMVLVTLVVVAAAALLSYSRTATYRAAADVLVQPRLFAAGTPPQAPDMGSEKAAAGSTVVLDAAGRALGISADRLSHGLTVSVPLNTHVLHISYSSANAEQAQQRAQAVATAYVSYWIAQQPLLETRTAGRTSPTDILKTSVITPAKRPTAPASPNHVVDISIALIIGLVLAAGTAYLRDRLDDRLRGPAEFETIAGPVLALVPVTGHARVDPVVARRPDTPGAAAYRELRTLLLRIAEQRGAKSLLITSPTGDAQTVASANVAVTIAQTGRRVVLVHADMRHPHGHELFGMDAVPGLADLLEGRANLTSVLHQTEIAGLQVLSAGLLMDDIGAALHPSRFGEVVRQLTMAADVVVIDAPAALAGSDIATMVDAVDMVLMVGDAGRTTRAQARAAADQLQHVGDRLVGSVLVNFGRRARLVTPPLSMVRSRRDHATPTPTAEDRVIDGEKDRVSEPDIASYDEQESEDDSAKRLLAGLADPSDTAANGRPNPASTRKG
jgi:polysaccharide biosynthesis transport protein